MKNTTHVPHQDISGYMPIDEHFLKDLDHSKLFMVIAGNDNAAFTISRGAFVLCYMTDAQPGDLIVDREELNMFQGVYKVMRYMKHDDYVFLENSSSQKIVTPAYKPFGVVLRIFNTN